MDFHAFYKISYGMFVVSSKADGKLNGYISNSVFQVTAEPPQIAVSCNKDNYTAEIIAKSGLFSVSVLEENTPSELIGNFGYKCGKDLDKFESVQYQTGETGIPIVTENTIAWFECKLIQTFDVGTHMLFIGEVINSQALAPDTDPLTYAYYRNVKKGVAPKNAPTYIDKSKLDKKEEIVPEAETAPTGGGDKAGGGDKYECLVCGHVYDPAEGDPGGGIPPGTAFEDIPDDWICPVCGTRKTDFTKI